ncbi:MAG: redox-regulated ATPase YchF [Fervidicoccaceae archaeon]
MTNYRPPLIGVIGKTNVGKTTFFSAATLVNAEISNRPFTTINPNIGIGYVRVRCPHAELGLPSCEPRTGFCLRGTRFVPVELIDVAGLIRGAHEGRGLGNKFLDDLRKADALLLVIDAAGATDDSGNPLPPGSSDPAEEAATILDEVAHWLAGILASDWRRLITKVESQAIDPAEAIAERLSGLGVKRVHASEALRRSALEKKRLSEWTRDDLLRFARELRAVSKPLLIVANKADLPEAKEGLERLRGAFSDILVVPASAQAELALKRAWAAGLIDYVPGEGSFVVRESGRLSEAQRRALEYVKRRVLEIYGSTGVQQAIEKLVFEVARYVAVFPVENAEKLTDGEGRILPDVFLVREGSTVREVARLVHTELAEKFVAAIDARRGVKLGEDSEVYNGMVFKVITRAR